VKAPSTTSASTNAKTVASTDGAGSDDGYVYAPTKAEAKQYDTFTDASGKVWNRNTHDTNDVSPFMAGGKQVMGHVPREPRDPNAPPPMNLHTSEETAKTIAMEAVRGAGGDARLAMHNMERPGEKERAVAAGMTSRHYIDAAAELAREQSSDAMRARQINSLYPLKKGTQPVSTAPSTPPAGGGVGRTSSGAPLTPPASTGDGGTSMGTDPQLEQDPAVQRTLNALKVGTVKMSDLDGSEKLSAEQKAAVHRLFVRRTN
jgi:hypothetical protein